MSAEQLCRGKTADGEPCPCGLNKDELKEAGVGIGQQCPECHHTLGCHPTAPAVAGVGTSQDTLPPPIPTVTGEVAALALRKEVFVKLLEDAGISPVGALQIARFNRRIKHVFEKNFDFAIRCIDSSAAKAIYDRTEMMVTTQTQRTFESHGVYFDGDLPGAFSNKACLQRVLYYGKLCVFKYPLSNTTEFKNSVQKDFEFCDQVKISNSGKLFEGIVHYESFTVTRNDGDALVGSLSPMYPMTLSDFTCKFTEQTVYDICSRVHGTLRKIHAIKFCVCDLKMENLYIDVDGNVDIADFGGFGELGAPLGEHTPGVVPQEYIVQGVCSEAVDKMCLVAVALRMLGIHVADSSVPAYKRKVADMDNGQLKSFLNSLF